MTTSPIDAVERYIDTHLPTFLADLTRLVAIPSISSRGEGIEEAASVVAELLSATGLAAEVMPTAGFPVVFADSGGTSGKTLICYNHYDVQPAEPLDLWHSPPFEARER